MPLVIDHIIYLEFSLIIRIFQPIWFQYPTSLLTSTAETAMSALREDHPSISTSGQRNAWSINKRQNSITEDIMSA